MICPNRVNFFKYIDQMTILKIARERGFELYEVNFVYNTSCIYVIHVNSEELREILTHSTYLSAIGDDLWYNLKTDIIVDDCYLDNQGGMFSLVTCIDEDKYEIPLTRNILEKIFLEEGCSKMRSSLTAEIKDLIGFVDSIPDEIKVMILSN